MSVMIHERRVAIVTGTSLGRAAAIGLAQDGFDVVQTFRTDEAPATRCADAIHAAGGAALTMKADIDDEGDRQAIVSTTVEKFGRVDALISAVGEFERERLLFSDYTAQRVQGLVANNLTSPMLLDLLVLPWMRRARWGRIVHFGFGRVAEGPGWPHRAVYAAAKTGLMAFTKSLAGEEIQHGITVNMVCPGEIRGSRKDMRVRDVEGQEDPENPGVRPGTGEDVAHVVRVLCRPESDYLTGAVIDVTGGLAPIRSLSIKTPGRV
jgi:3-oxoacyl-[acyl-carrier protein] reductase